MRSATAEDIKAILELHTPKPWCAETSYWMEVVRSEYQMIFDHAQPLTLHLSLIEGDRLRLAATIVVVLVNEPFAQELLSSDAPWTNQKMRMWMESGKNPFMSRKDIAQANCGDGVTMLPITFWWDRSLPEEKGAYLRQLVLHRFADKYAGYKLRRMIAEPCDRFLLQGCFEVGYRLVNDYQEWATAVGMVDHPHRPFLLVAESGDAFSTVNSFLLRMFSYEKPRLGLSPSQQDVLLLAVDAIADAEIAQHLSIGIDALKARWKAIYRKVDLVIPGLLPEGEGGSRGIEKRRVLLQYLRDRPEELRPHL